MCSFDDVPTVEALAALTPAEVEAKARELDVARRQAEVAMALFVARVEAAGAYRIDGHRRVVHWARAACNWSTKQARRQARLGRLLLAWPLLLKEGGQGRVGLDQLHLLDQLTANPRVAEHLGGGEKMLVTAAIECDFDDLVTVVAQWEAAADPDGSHRASEAVHRDRRAHMSHVGETMYLDAMGGLAAGLPMQAIFDAYCDTEWLADWEEGAGEHGDSMCAAKMSRTDRQRRFDALQAIFQAAADALPRPADAPTPTVNLLIGAERFHHTVARMLGADPPPLDPNDPDHRCETTVGVPVDPFDAVMAAFNGTVRRVIVDGAGAVLDVGRRQRLFTGRLRDAVLLHHRRCIWPGCTHPAERCQADHLIPWSRDGNTAAVNGGPGCGRHNRWRTRGYTTRRDCDGHWHHYRGDGTEIGWRADLNTVMAVHVDDVSS